MTHNAVRLGLDLVALFSASFGLLSVPTACQPAAIPARPTVSLRMQGTPPDATVTIDEQMLGSLDRVAAHGVALPAGVHRVTVKDHGYFPWDREINAVLGQGPIQIQVTLTKVPD